jgi:hypothetical protein
VLAPTRVLRIEWKHLLHPRIDSGHLAMSIVGPFNTSCVARQSMLLSKLLMIKQLGSNSELEAVCFGTQHLMASKFTQARDRELAAKMSMKSKVCLIIF